MTCATITSITEVLASSFSTISSDYTTTTTSWTMKRVSASARQCGTLHLEPKSCLKSWNTCWNGRISNILSNFTSIHGNKFEHKIYFWTFFIFFLQFHSIGCFIDFLLKSLFECVASSVNVTDQKLLILSEGFFFFLIDVLLGNARLFFNQKCTFSDELCCCFN